MSKNQDSADEAAIDKAIRLQNLLIAQATGGEFYDGGSNYKALRNYFMARSDTKTRLPDFVRRCNDIGQFWGYISYQSSNYKGRREHIWEAFRPLIEYLEFSDRAPGVVPITETLQSFDVEHVHAAWQKALDRRIDDPEGAITAARTLIETVCKYILDDANTGYADDADLPKLWAMASEQTNLAPSQHQEQVFKSILGNCQSIVGNLSAIRNRVGDAHGQGRRPVKPKPRHAELAVNLAGAMSSFLVATWIERKEHDDS